MLKIIFTIYLVLAFLSLSSNAQTIEDLPPYQPQQEVSGIIRLWGHGSFKRNFMGELVKQWQTGFRKFHPDFEIDFKMYGTASAIGGLYTGVGDIAILGEEINPQAAVNFERVFGYKPFGVEIATGSLDVRNFDYAQMFFVNKDNPVMQLTLAQLDAIFGCEHRRGLSKNIRTWDALGLTGEWKDKPIQPYGWAINDSFGLFLQDALLGGSNKWNSDLREYKHINRPDGTIYDHGQQILDDLANDKFGIAVSNIRYANPNVKALAISAYGKIFFAATKENLINRKYPLARFIPAYINREPNKPIKPLIKEFLLYLLSREGQQDIISEGGYLPMSREAILRDMKRLE